MTTATATAPAPEITALQKLDAARQMLAQARSVGETKQIRDQAEALRVYAQEQKYSLECVNYCTEIKIRAERKAGELLAAMRESGQRAGRGDKEMSGKTTLEELGITRDQSSQWQRVASIEEEAFERWIADIKNAGDRLSTTGLLEAVARQKGKKETRDRGQTTEEFLLRLAERIDGVKHRIVQMNEEWLPLLTGNPDEMRKIAEAARELATTIEKQTAAAHNRARKDQRWGYHPNVKPAETPAPSASPVALWLNEYLKAAGAHGVDVTDRTNGVFAAGRLKHFGRASIKAAAEKLGVVARMRSGNQFGRSGGSRLYWYHSECVPPLAVTAVAPSGAPYTEKGKTFSTTGSYHFKGVNSALQKAVRRAAPPDSSSFAHDVGEAQHWWSEFELVRGFSDGTKQTMRKLAVITSEDIGLAHPTLAAQVRGVINRWTKLERTSEQAWRLWLGALDVMVRIPKSRIVDDALVYFYKRDGCSGVPFDEEGERLQSAVAYDQAGKGEQVWNSILHEARESGNAILLAQLDALRLNWHEFKGGTHHYDRIFFVHAVMLAYRSPKEMALGAVPTIQPWQGDISKLWTNRPDKRTKPIPPWAHDMHTNPHKYDLVDFHTRSIWLGNPADIVNHYHPLVLEAAKCQCKQPIIKVEAAQALAVGASGD